MTTPIRRAARVLLVDSDERILLLQGHDSTLDDDSRWWFTVGGGLEAGESLVRGALRELSEETGLVAAPGDLVGPVWEREAEFTFEGLRYHQHEWFFLLRVPRGTQVSSAGWVELERRSIVGHRWWPVDDLADTADQVHPDRLGILLRDLLRGGPPSGPVRLPKVVG